MRTRNAAVQGYCYVKVIWANLSLRTFVAHGACRPGHRRGYSRSEACLHLLRVSSARCDADYAQGYGSLAALGLRQPKSCMKDPVHDNVIQRQQVLALRLGCKSHLHVLTRMRALNNSSVIRPHFHLSYSCASIPLQPHAHDVVPYRC